MFGRELGDNSGLFDQPPNWDALYSVLRPTGRSVRTPKPGPALLFARFYDLCIGSQA